MAGFKGFLSLSLSLSPPPLFLSGDHKRKINPKKLHVSSLPPRSGRQNHAELLITRIYGGISVSHLLPASWGIKGEISGWHWDGDYPVCVI